MPRDWSTSTFGERVRHAVKAGGFSSQNEAGKAAGIESGPLSRLATDESPTAGRRSADLVGKLAMATRVSVRWLTDGVGQPDEAAAQAAPSYPSKLPAAKAMEGIVDPQSIAAMLSEEHRGSEVDPGAAFWMERAIWWQRERARLRKVLDSGESARESDGLNSAPAMAPRPKVKRGRK